MIPARSGCVVSQHLKVLRTAGLVTVRVDHNRRLSSVDFGRSAELRRFLDLSWHDKLAALEDAGSGVRTGRPRIESAPPWVGAAHVDPSRRRRRRIRRHRVAAGRARHPEVHPTAVRGRAAVGSACRAARTLADPGRGNPRGQRGRLRHRVHRARAWGRTRRGRRRADLFMRLPRMESERAREDLGWSPRFSSREAIGELIRGLRHRAGGRTLPLHSDGGPVSTPPGPEGSELGSSGERSA